MSLTSASAWTDAASLGLINDDEKDAKAAAAVRGEGGLQ